MIKDEFFFNDESNSLFGMTWITKTRLVKYVEKKTGKFMYWSIDVKSQFVEDKCDPEILLKYDDPSVFVGDMMCLLDGNYVPCGGSGIFDYTPEGEFFGLSESQKQRALSKQRAKF